MDRSYEILSHTSPIERRAALVDDLAVDPQMADILVAMASMPPNLAAGEADAWIQASVLNTQKERIQESVIEYSLYNRAQLMIDAMGKDAPIIMGFLNRLYGDGDPDAAAEGKAAHEAEMQEVTDHLDELLAFCQDVENRGLPAIVMSDKLREFISPVMPVNPADILEGGLVKAIRAREVTPVDQPRVEAPMQETLPVAHHGRGLTRRYESGPQHRKSYARNFDLGAACKAVKVVYRETISDRRSYGDDPSPKPPLDELYDVEEQAPEVVGLLR